MEQWKSVTGGGGAGEAAAFRRKSMQDQGTDEQQVWRMRMQTCFKQQRERKKAKLNPSNNTAQALIISNDYFKWNLTVSFCLLYNTSRWIQN